MKKVIALLLALMVCLGLCACGGGEDAQIKADAEKYNEYKDLIDKIEAGDFAGAYSDFVDRFPEQEVSAPTIDAGDITLDGVVVGTPDTESTVTAVEITTDNWQEYFEIVYKEKWVTNAFGEAENLRVYQSFQVKDAYKDRVSYGPATDTFALALSQIDVEIGYNATYYSVTVNLENQTYTKGGIHEHTDLWGGAQTAINTFYFNPSQTGWSCLCSDIYPGDYSSIVEWDSIEVLRIQGTLYLKDR